MTLHRHITQWQWRELLYISCIISLTLHKIPKTRNWMLGFHTSMLVKLTDALSATVPLAGKLNALSPPADEFSSWFCRQTCSATATVIIAARKEVAFDELTVCAASRTLWCSLSAAYQFVWPHSRANPSPLHSTLHTAARTRHAAVNYHRQDKISSCTQRCRSFAAYLFKILLQYGTDWYRYAGITLSSMDGVRMISTAGDVVSVVSFIFTKFSLKRGLHILSF